MNRHRIARLAALCLASAVVLAAAGVPTAACAADETAWHRYLVQYAYFSYDRLFVGEIVDVKADGLRRMVKGENGQDREILFDVATAKVALVLKDARPGATEYLLYHRRETDLRTEESRLFAVKRGNAVNPLEEPWRVVRGRLVLDDASYPLADVQRWCGEAAALGRERFAAGTRAFQSRRAELDRRAAFRHRQRAREAWLLMRINRTDKADELVGLYEDLGRTRLGNGDAEGAERAFLYMRETWSRTPNTVARAERGLALVLFARGKLDAAVREVERLLGGAAARLDRQLAVELRVDLARLLEKQGKTARALETYLAVAADKEAPAERRAFACFNLGEILRGQGRKAEAIKAYQESDGLFRQHQAATFRTAGAAKPAWVVALEARLREK